MKLKKGKADTPTKGTAMRAYAEVIKQVADMTAAINSLTMFASFGQGRMNP